MNMNYFFGITLIISLGIVVWLLFKPSSNVQILLGIVALSFTLFLMYFLYKREKSEKGATLMSNQPVSAPQISEELDTLHQDILGKFDSLYDSMKTSWSNENTLFEQGKEKLCSGHVKVEAMQVEHQNVHTGMTNRLLNLKNEFVQHMENMDAKHFHWL